MNATFFIAGLVCGLVFTAGWIIALMRARMIEVHKSLHGFDETVSRLERAVIGAGWLLSDSKRMNDTFEKKEVFFKPKVHLIKLCEPHHATEVLKDNRRVACLMPCTFAVYEDDDGAVFISRTNTRLMGRVFGGSIARVMGGEVAKAEQEMLKTVLE